MQSNARRTNRNIFPVALSLLALILAVGAFFRPEISGKLGFNTPSSSPTPVPVVAQAAAVTPTITPVTLSESCPAGQKDYEKQLFGDEGAPLGGYVTLVQFARNGVCWLEVRHYTAGKSGIWYYAAAIPDKHRTSYPLRLLDGTEKLFLVVYINQDYRLNYMVESVR